MFNQLLFFCRGPLLHRNKSEEKMKEIQERPREKKRMERKERQINKRQRKEIKVKENRVFKKNKSNRKK